MCDWTAHPPDRSGKPRILCNLPTELSTDGDERGLFLAKWPTSEECKLGISKFLSKGWLNLWAKYSGPKKPIAIVLFLSELKELEVRNQNAEFSFGFWSWSLFRKLKLRQDFKTAFWPSLFRWSLLKYGNVYVLIGKFSESPSSWNTLLITLITGCNDFSFPQSSQK